MWRRLLCSTILLATTAPAGAARSRGAGEDLMQVVSPPSREVASAHPHVNAIISFGLAKDGTAADPSTFRAKLNGKDVTRAFHAIMTGATQSGVRAVLPQAALRLVRSSRNRLRLSIQGVKTKGPRVRDVDRVRFGAADTPNAPPVVALAAGSELAAVGQPIDFDASGSRDPDLDELSFSWTFSDGGTASGATVTHTFTAAGDTAVTATVTVSDGVASVAQTLAVPVALDPDPGRTPGQLRIEGPALEFSSVGIGAVATRSLVVRNVDTTPTSQVKIHATVDAPGFGVAPGSTIDLGPDQSATLDVTFAPAAAGHTSARLMVIASAANRRIVTFLAHGYGGAAPGDGPTGVAVPVYAVFGSDVTRLAPEGGRSPIDDGTGTCGPPAAAGTGDVCIQNGDCEAGGEVCSAPTTPLDVSELCSDGQSLFVLSEDSYQDPRLDPNTELSGTLVRFDLDPAGNVTGREVLYRTTDGTNQLACDGFGAGAGGLAYLAEYHDVTDTTACQRDERDALVAVNKGTGNASTVSGFTRIDQAAGVGDCDFRDPVDQLAIGADGVKKYAGFDSHGLWRIAPTPLWFTPDVRDTFQVHADGSVAFAVGRDRGTSGTIEVYRLSESEVEHGALPLAALTPCATFTIPNNTTADAPSRTFVTSIVLGPTGLSGPDATALVTFQSRPSAPAFDVLPPAGGVRGTVAFALPGATTTCTAAGLVTLDATELSR